MPNTSKVATCEDYNSDIDDIHPNSEIQANVAAKRKSHSSALGKEEPHDQPPPARFDIASDSGYSSRTFATMSSADSAQSNDSGLQLPNVVDQLPPVADPPKRRNTQAKTSKLHAVNKSKTRQRAMSQSGEPLHNGRERVLPQVRPPPVNHFDDAAVGFDYDNPSLYNAPHPAQQQQYFSNPASLPQIASLQNCQTSSSRPLSYHAGAMHDYYPWSTPDIYPWPTSDNQWTVTNQSPVMGYPTQNYSSSQLMPPYNQIPTQKVSPTFDQGRPQLSARMGAGQFSARYVPPLSIENMTYSTTGVVKSARLPQPNMIGVPTEEALVRYASDSETDERSDSESVDAEHRSTCTCERRLIAPPENPHHESSKKELSAPRRKSKSRPRKKELTASNRQSKSPAPPRERLKDRERPKKNQDEKRVTCVARPVRPALSVTTKSSTSSSSNSRRMTSTSNGRKLNLEVRPKSKSTSSGNDGIIVEANIRPRSRTPNRKPEIKAKRRETDSIQCCEIVPAPARSTSPELRSRRSFGKFTIVEHPYMERIKRVQKMHELDTQRKMAIVARKTQELLDLNASHREIPREQWWQFEEEAEREMEELERADQQGQLIRRKFEEAKEWWPNVRG